MGSSAVTGPLAGFTIGVTADRRREELGTALERRGARIVYAPAIRIVPLADDTQTRAATGACIDTPPDVVVVTTGVGFRGWLEAADGWGVGPALRERLAGAEIVARGPKATGAIRAAGLRETWSPASESTGEVLDYLLQRDLCDRRVAIQLHGEPIPDLVNGLRSAGARLVEVPVYRWLPAEDCGPLRALLRSVADREIHAVVFTSAPAAVSVLRTAEQDGLTHRLLDALRTDVLACCVGPVTAAPLGRVGVPVLVPGRARLGALVREIAEQLPLRSVW